MNHSPLIETRKNTLGNENRRLTGLAMKKLKDQAQEEFRRGRQALDVIFCPKSVAVIGATERLGSVGRTVMANLIREQRLADRVFPINPQRPGVLGAPAYKSIEDV